MKRKPPQPNPINMLAYNGGNPDPDHPNHRGQPGSTESAPPGSSGPGLADEHEWQSAEETNRSYARLESSLRDFVYGISRGYSVRHACRMSGEDYERMLDYLNNRHHLFKRELFLLVEKARGVAYARQVEKLNASPDWHAAAFWLERRERREFAPPRLGEEGDDTAERPKALIRMSPETLEALSAAYDAEHGTANDERADT
jgi:hypothetical protein